MLVRAPSAGFGAVIPLVDVFRTILLPPEWIEGHRWWEIETLTTEASRTSLHSEMCRREMRMVVKVAPLRSQFGS